MGREIKFKPATFYLGIADHLARVVEGQGQEPGEDQSAQEREAEGTRQVDERRDERTEETREEEERAEMLDSLRKGEENIP